MGPRPLSLNINIFRTERNLLRAKKMLRGLKVTLIIFFFLSITLWDVTGVDVRHSFPLAS